MADESLDDILSSSASTPETPAPAPAEPTPAEAPPEGGPSRDEHGRFAPKAETPAPADGGETPAIPKPEAAPTMVPLSVLHEERDKRQELERKFAALEAAQRQPPKPAEPEKPIEIWDDPGQFVDRRNAPVREAMDKQRFGISEIIAVQQHGADKVQAARTALAELQRSNPQAANEVAQKIGPSMHPIGDLVGWHQEQQNRARIGSDPDAFVNSEIERLISEGKLSRVNADPAAGQAARPANVTPIAPSLSKLPGGSADEPSGRQTLDEILSSGRRRA